MALVHEKVWIDKKQYDDAERQYQERLAKLSTKDILTSPLEKEIQLIPVKQTDLVAKLNKDNKEKSEKSKKVECEKKKVDSPVKEAEKMDSIADFAGVPSAELTNRITSLAKENADLKQVVEDLRKLVLGVQQQVNALESKVGGVPVASKTSPAPKADDSDDGVDLFASDSEDEGTEAVKIREERLAAYAAKKAKKPVLIAKSNIILDVKPWDDETDMKAMEAAVRTIQTEGLLWGAAKLVPLAYGIHKLQISSVVEDDKVSVDWLQEELEKLEDFVQSVDIAAFNKV